MKRFLCITVLLLTAVTLAQQPAATANPKTPTLTIPAGQIFRVILSNELDSKKMKPGDPVRMENAAALKGADGKVAIPAGAKFFGKVTLAEGRTKEHPSSALALLIERVEWKGGSIALHASFVPTKSTQPEPATSGQSDNKPQGRVFTTIVQVNGAVNTPPISVLNAPTGGFPGSDAGFTQGPSPFSETRGELSSDPAIGTVLRSETRNIVIPMGAHFIIKQLAPVR